MMVLLLARAWLLRFFFFFLSVDLDFYFYFFINWGMAIFSSPLLFSFEELSVSFLCT